jgi:Domain of unknown function (DUF1929)
VGPNGRAFYSGPDQTMRSLNTAGGGSWQSLGQRDTINRGYGSRALYDVGKILVAGGGNSSREARVINLNGATPQVSQTAPMANGCRQHNLTVLADGSVLATGGNSSGAELIDMNNGVYAAELWNSATGTWKTMAAEQVTRQYHSTALLLPDGRVLSSGGGICGTCDEVGYLAKNAQVFTPPYLFKKDGSGQLAARPQITAVADALPYNAPFWISTPNPGSIGKVALVRLGAVTHSVNMDQRYVPLGFAAGAGTINATSPPNANIAPPGVYMLFVTGSEGVPSAARMVRIDPSAPRPSPPPPTDPPPPVPRGTTSTTAPPGGRPKLDTKPPVLKARVKRRQRVLRARGGRRSRRLRRGMLTDRLGTVADRPTLVRLDPQPDRAGQSLRTAQGAALPRRDPSAAPSPSAAPAGDGANQPAGARRGRQPVLAHASHGAGCPLTATGPRRAGGPGPGTRGARNPARSRSSQQSWSCSHRAGR